MRGAREEEGAAGRQVHGRSVHRGGVGEYFLGTHVHEGMSAEIFTFSGETPELRAYLTHVQAPQPRAEAWEAERRRPLVME